MKLRRVVAFAMAALMTVSLFGCGGNGGETKPAGGEQNTAAAGEVDRSQELVVYSNSTSNGQDEWLLKVAKEAGFNLNIVSIDGSALADRLVAEKNNPVCDVVFGLNAVEYERLKAEGLLVKYEPEWVNEVDMSLGDADGYYYPTVVQPLMLIYNKDVVTNPPADWTDLVKPEYNDQYTMFGSAAVLPR